VRRILIAAVAAVIAVLVLAGCAAGPYAVTKPVGPAPTPVATSSVTPTPSVAPSQAFVPAAAATDTAVAVPNVVGKPIADATRVLMAAGFTVKRVNKANAAKSGIVFAQSPAAGAVSAPGSAITLSVSTGPAAPGNTEILTVFARHYSPYKPIRRSVVWKGVDKRGVWWAAVSLYDGIDAYAIAGYRTAPNKWVVQAIGQPDGSVMVSSTWLPKPPAEVVAAMKRAGVPVFE
jgi:hypothetical protein